MAQARQNPSLPTRPSPEANNITQYKNLVREDIAEADLPKARAEFAKLAKYYADVVNHPAVRRASQDLKMDLFNPVPTIDGPNGILRDLDRYLLEPTVGGPVGSDKTIYIREFGAALDAALKPLIAENPERWVRVNAARVLAHAARSGAAAHFKTVTELLTDPKTKPEVKHYLLQAAAALLAAGDVNDIKIRKHAADPPVLNALVKAVDDCITNPAVAILNLKSTTIPSDQLDVVGLIRRQAIRALAQVKWVVIPNADGKPDLYPAHTLVRVAMNDPSLQPAPRPADAAEAVIGICNMAPVYWHIKRLVPVKEYNPEVAAEAVLQGLITFAGPRAANINDKQLPWRLTSLRVAEALHKWRPLFDPLFDPTQPAKFADNLVPASVKDIYIFTLPNVLAPMEKVDFQGKPVPAAVVDIQGLIDRRNRLRDGRQQSKKNLFEGVPETSVNFAPPKK